MKAITLLIAALALTGCAREADMVPLNDAAHAAGIPRLDVALYGTGYGPAIVTMADGEVLNGHYHLATGRAVAVGFGTVSDPRRSVVGSSVASVAPMQNPLTLQAIGRAGTMMTCEGSAGGMGHGECLCTTNHGAQYQMMF